MIIKGTDVIRARVIASQAGKNMEDVGDIISVGEDAVIVRGYTEEKLEKQAKVGGISRALKKRVESFREEAPKIIERAKEKTRQLTKITRKKAEEIQERPETQRALHQIKGQIKKAKKTVKRKLKQM